MILPGFGIASQIIPTFSRKKLFGYHSMVYATASIAFLSFIVWGHHMFATGMPLATELFFMYATMLIAVPTGVKVFNWVATMWRGSITFETPMLFAIGFVVMFTIGGFSGLMLAIVPADFQYHDTFFVVAHLHYVLYPGAIFATMGAVYYWLPKWTGHMYDERLGKIHFWMAVVGLNLTFFPMHFVGLAGMPRRIVLVHCRQDHSRWRESDRSGLGVRGRARMDNPFARPTSHLPNAAAREVAHR
jgi:cytochrome c oxidase subunit 1